MIVLRSDIQPWNPMSPQVWKHWSIERPLRYDVLGRLRWAAHIQNGMIPPPFLDSLIRIVLSHHALPTLSSSNSLPSFTFALRNSLSYISASVSLSLSACILPTLLPQLHRFHYASSSFNTPFLYLFNLQSRSSFHSLSFPPHLTLPPSPLPCPSPALLGGDHPCATKFNVMTLHCPTTEAPREAQCLVPWRPP